MLLRRYALCMIMLCVWLTGCGNRGMPVIKQELLDKKLSVLMLTGPSLSDAAKQSIGAALLQWRETNGIAFEWVKDLPALDDQVVNKLKSRTYDYIYVAGNDLIATAPAVMDPSKLSGKWTLLQDNLFVGASGVSSDKAALLTVDPNQVDSLKNKWVNDLLLQRSSIEWVTRADSPIPSEWAPSEEADHIVLLDNNEQWYQQLSYQVRHHGSNWVVFYTPVDQTFVQKAKSIGSQVQVMDLTNAWSIELNWDVIMADRLAAMTQRTWKNGTIVYNQQELKELKMK